MSLIDLGEVRDEAVPEPGPSPRRRGDRLLRAAGVLALALFTLGAATPSVPLPTATVPARLGASTHLTGDLLLVADPPDLTGDSDNPPPQLIAYRLPQAEEVWRTPVPFPGEIGAVKRNGDLLLLSGYSGNQPESRLRTVAVRAGDGSPRWQFAGWPSGFTVGGLALFWGDSDGTETWCAVDPQTGQVRWTLPQPGAGGVAAVTRSKLTESLVFIDPSGAFDVYGAESGQRTATGTLPLANPAWPYRMIVYAHGLLIATDTGGTVTAYRYPGLDQGWSVQIDRRQGEFHLSPCGRYLCTFEFNGGIQVLDPATGRVLAADRRWQLVLAYGDHLLATSAGDRAAPAKTVWAVDPRAGKVPLDLGSWHLAGFEWVGTHEIVDPVIGVRVDPASRRMLIAELDPAEPRPRLLGAARDISGQCHAASGLLVCRRMDGSFGIWAVP